MSETEPPNSGNPPPPKTSGLAVWSLVLGIASLILLVLCSLLPLAAIVGVFCGHKALNRIKSSGGTLKGKGLAIGGLVTGYLGILLMVAIVLPNNFRSPKSAQTNECILNLHLIDSAKHQWAQEQKKTSADTPTMQDLMPYLGGPQGVLPLTCPSGGVYTIGPVGGKPTCSFPGHVLP